MIRISSSRNILLLLLLSAAGLAAACGSDDTPATPTRSPSSLPPGSPYIFEGTFTVAGRPGPAGASIFARMVDTRSRPVLADEGTYKNVIVGPVTDADFTSDIHFFIGDPDSEHVEAEEVFKYTPANTPVNVIQHLTFPRMP